MESGLWGWAGPAPAAGITAETVQWWRWRTEQKPLGQDRGHARSQQQQGQGSGAGPGPWAEAAGVLGAATVSSLASMALLVKVRV